MPKTWIEVLKCGKKAIQELQDHYYDTSGGAQRKRVVKYDSKKIFYNIETTFKFEKYVTKIKGIFHVLERYGVTLHEEKM